MTLLENKIPILTAINDVPSVGGQPNHPNASLLCANYNALIDELITINDNINSQLTTIDTQLTNAGILDLDALQQQVVNYGTQLDNFTNQLNAYGANFTELDQRSVESYKQALALRNVIIYGDNDTLSPTLNSFTNPYAKTIYPTPYVSDITVTGWSWGGPPNSTTNVSADSSSIIPDIGTLTIYANGTVNFTPINGFRGTFMVIVNYDSTVLSGQGGTTYLNITVIDEIPNVVPVGSGGS